MAQLAVAVAGAAIGFAVGGPAGAQIGFAVGSFLGSSLGPGTTTQGPRLSDLKVQVSSYGQSIAEGWGGFPVAGNIIWATDLEEHANSEEVGKGGPSQTSVSYTYSASFAVALCEGPIAGVRRIWADSKLVYDARDDADADTIDASAEFAEFFTLYLGTEDQTPDPTMEAEKGVGEVPAYLGTAYIVFTDLPLADYGNRIPNFLFEVFTVGAPAPSQGDGILCHFEDLDGDGKVISEVGPNMLMTGGAALVSDPKKWGDSAGDADGVGKNFGATGMTGSLNRAWRVEGWWYVDEADEAFFQLGSGSTFPSVSLSREGIFNDACFNIGSVSNSGSGGGRFGSAGLRPPLDAWAHIGLEYDPTSKNVYAFCNGTRVGIAINGGGSNPFQDGVFTSCNVYRNCDDFFLHFDVELYGESYPVPTGPFEANNNGETFTPGEVFLPDVVSAICEDCGLEASEIDVTDLPNTEVLGYTRPRQMPGRAALDPLRQVFWFDAVESDGKVKFVSRGGSSLVTIDEDELGAIEGENDPQPATEPVRAQEAELPAVINVAYLDRDVDYENGAQTARRVVTGSVQQQSLELPIVLTHQQAADAASVLLYDAWTARTEVSWSTTKKYAKYEPTDVVTLADGAITRQVRITDKSEEGPVIKWKGRDEKPSVYDPNATPSEPTGTGATIRITGDTVVELIDAPILQIDTFDNPGFWVAARGTKPGWNGGVLYQSADNGTSYSQIKQVTSRATMGVTLTALGDWDGGYVVDEVNTLEVQLHTGTLATVTRDQLLNGEQGAIVGDEVIGFQRAELIAENTYRLSGLIRGGFGTEDHIGDHAVGDRFVLIDTTWYRVDQPLSSVDSERLYKAVTFNKSIEAAPAEAFTNTARGLLPLSPHDLRGERSNGADIRLWWKRRSRYSARFLSSVPLGETSEAYEVDIYSNGSYTTVLRTLSATSAEASYTGDQQVADFGDIQSTLYVRVYQMSESVGRGSVLEGSVTVSPAAPSSILLYNGLEQSQTITSYVDVRTDGFLLIKQLVTVSTPNSGYSYDGATFNWNLSATGSGPTDGVGINAIGHTLTAASTVNEAGTYLAVYLEGLPGLFERVTWSGNGSGARDIPHSLGVAPALALVRRTDDFGTWLMYSSRAGANKSLEFPVTGGDAFATDTASFTSLSTSSNFKVGSALNASGADWMALLFSSTSSLCKEGTYTGNGSASGPSITGLGFKPHFLIVRSLGSTARNTLATSDVIEGTTYTHWLMDDAGSAFSKTSLVTLTSDGFDVVSTSGTVNESGVDYQYIAFTEWA